MSKPKVTIEKLECKDSKEHIDGLIEKIGEAGGSLPICGDFTIQFEYVDNPNIREAFRGFSITILPKDRDGRGISVKLDPHDNKICSGLVEVFEENNLGEK